MGGARGLGGRGGPPISTGQPPMHLCAARGTQRSARTVMARLVLAYPVRDLAPDAFVADVSRQAAGCVRIPFVLRWALPFKDVTGEGTDVFLVPEEGFSALARLHDRLYAGALASRLRLDIPTIPHLTVAHSADPQACKRLADALNARPLAISGTI